MSVAIFMLRCFQMGIHIDELDDMDSGLIMDMITESGNDNCEYPEIATQDDFERF